MGPLTKSRGLAQNSRCYAPSNLVGHVKSLVLTPVKRRLRQAHRALTFRRAISETERALRRNLPVSAALAQRLVYGWSNEAWSAKPALTAYLLNSLRGFSGTLLECGSGLSTILLSLLARDTGSRVLTLEHDPRWLDLTRNRLRQLRIDDRDVLLAPLKSFGDFDWYSDLPEHSLPGLIDVILCDGPPNSTRGGRYGTLPRLKHKLADGALIVVDDSRRAEEAQMIARWIEESEGKIEMIESFPTFAVLRHRC